MKGICVLGATGSIGISTLDVVGRHPELYRVVALTANRLRRIDIAVGKEYQLAIPGSRCIGQADAIGRATRLDAVLTGRIRCGIGRCGGQPEQCTK